LQELPQYSVASIGRPYHIVKLGGLVIVPLIAKIPHDRATICSKLIRAKLHLLISPDCLTSQLCCRPQFFTTPTIDRFARSTTPLNHRSVAPSLRRQGGPKLARRHLAAQRSFVVALSDLKRAKQAADTNNAHV
jgi:hypothetical protein